VIVSPKKDNNIGFIRLAAASMVIVAHSPELIDGNESREVLNNIFGTLSFGALGVDIFFLMSGYLITKSCISSDNLSYLVRRVLRIYPAYVVAYLICIVIVAPLAGGKLSAMSLMECVKVPFNALLLGLPIVPGTFASHHHSDLNGAMWTIRYEFKCYLLVMLVKNLGIYKNERLSLVLPILFLLLWGVCAIYFPFNKAYDSGLFGLLVGRPEDLMRFAFIFSCGGCFYLFRENIKYSAMGASICAIGVLSAMFNKVLAEPVVAVLGGYLLFYLAFKARKTSINRDYDISYGLYLYAWPISQLIILYFPSVPPIYLACATFIFGSIMGMASWFLIEKPATASIGIITKMRT
jgi:peptidoglycan/LPS O-acetylase OafA/YrhL